MKSIPELNFEAGFEKQLMAQIESVGVAKVHGTVTPDGLEALNHEFDCVISSCETGVRDLGVEVGSAKDVERFKLKGEPFPELIKYFSQEWMQRCSDLYWGDSRVLNDHVFVSLEIPGTKHLAQDLHFDVQETLKFFLYLNDVTAENGAFSCVPGSLKVTRQKREQIEGDFNYENLGPTREHQFRDEEILPVEGAAGDLIVFTTEVWHRAGHVEKGERRVMRGHTRQPKRGHTSGGEQPCVDGKTLSQKSLIRRVISKLF